MNKIDKYYEGTKQGNSIIMYLGQREFNAINKRANSNAEKNQQFVQEQEKQKRANITIITLLSICQHVFSRH